MTADQLSKLSLQNVRYYLNSALATKTAFLAIYAAIPRDKKDKSKTMNADDTAYKNYGWIIKASAVLR